MNNNFLLLPDAGQRTENVTRPHCNARPSAVARRTLGLLAAAVFAALPGLANAQSFWQLNGNSGTIPRPDFLGTTDNHPLELKVNGERALRLEYGRDTNRPAFAPNVIGGIWANYVPPGVAGATIAGGGFHDFAGTGMITSNVVSGNYSSIGGGTGNSIGSHAATIAGGVNHMIGTNAAQATIGGGDGHTITSGAAASFIGGGELNSLGSNSAWATIGGGHRNAIDAGKSVIAGGNQNIIGVGAHHSGILGGEANRIDTDSDHGSIGGGDRNVIGISTRWCTISGGSGNLIESEVKYGTIGGGANNRITGSFSGATIPGGRSNVASGHDAFAAGLFAHALHNGTFVWGDRSTITTAAPFESRMENQFLIRANNGVGINTTETAGTALNVAGNAAFSGNVGIGKTAPEAKLDVAGKVRCEVLELTSDRNAKAGFEAVDPRAVLQKVARLPLSTWHYTNAPNVRHIGPMAQDFHAAFGLGSDDKHIATVDADGVLFASVQALNQRLEDSLKEKEARIAVLEQKLAQMDALAARLAAVEKLMAQAAGFGVPASAGPAPIHSDRFESSSTLLAKAGTASGPSASAR